jgi:hypothetical protein
MASNNVGTNFFTQTGDTNVYVALKDGSGNAMLGYAPTANMPSAVAGYGVGCLLLNTTSGSAYANIGSATSCTFVTVSVT